MKLHGSSELTAEDVAFSIDCVAPIPNSPGPLVSGCVTSTLGRLAVGLLVPTEGDRLWQGRPLAGLPATDARAQQLATCR